MERSKRRVSRVGQNVLKKKCSIMDDVVTDVMQRMDAALADSGNQDIGMPPGYPNQQNASLPRPKKVQTAKRHSLMDKARKNINYIKHNRSMPKPRAHVGGLHDTVQKNSKKDEIHSARSSSSDLLKAEKKSSIPTKIRHNVSNRCMKNKFSCDRDASSKCDKLPVSISDDESDFESFLQAHKKDPNWEKKNASKSKTKKNTRKMLSIEHKSCLKQIKPAKVAKLKSVDLESYDESLYKTIRNKRDNKLVSKFTCALQLSDTSDSSGDEKEMSDKSFESGGKSPMMPPFVKSGSDCEVVQSEQLNKIDFMCTVRMERNPHLDAIVMQLKTPLKDKDNEQSNESCSELQGKENENMDDCDEEVIVLDSDDDDDCTVVFEVPKFCNRPVVDICVVESGVIEPDIQILNVVSLRDCQEVTGGNVVSKTSSSSCERNRGEINFEKLKEAIEITQALESYSNSASSKEGTLKPEVNDSNTDIMENITAASLRAASDFDLKEKVSLSLPASIIETVNRMDFKQILSLTSDENSKSPYLPDVKEFVSLPCSSSYSDSVPSFARLQSIICDDTKVIPESHCRNLEKAVSAKNCFLDATSDLSDSGNSSLMKSDIDTNLFDKVKTPSSEPSAINSELNFSDLKEILSNATHELTRSNGGNVFRGEDMDRSPLKKDYDDLGVLSTNSDRSQRCNQSSQNWLRLFSVFSEACHDYIGMNDYETRAASGLKVLQERKCNKRKQIETILEHMLEDFRCFNSTAMEHKETIVNNSIKADLTRSSENENALSEQMKICINCGSKSTIECANCKEVSFCTIECGEFYYWKKGHNRECEGFKQRRIE